MHCCIFCSLRKVGELELQDWMGHISAFLLCLRSRVGNQPMPGDALLPERRQALALGRGRTLASPGAVPWPVLGGPGACRDRPVRLSGFNCALHMANLRPPSTGSTCPVM